MKMMPIQKEAKRAADKSLRAESKRLGYTLSGTFAYTHWQIVYSRHIDDAGYKFVNGQAVRK